MVPTTIEFQVGSTWSAASDQYVSKVKAVRLTRFGGVVTVKFKRPRRVKLAPTDWADTWFTKAKCRNVLIDLLENNDKPTELTRVKKISYRISAGNL